MILHAYHKQTRVCNIHLICAYYILLQNYHFTLHVGYYTIHYTLYYSNTTDKLVPSTYTRLCLFVFCKAERARDDFVIHYTTVTLQSNSCLKYTHVCVFFFLLLYIHLAHEGHTQARALPVCNFRAERARDHLTGGRGARVASLVQFDIYNTTCNIQTNSCLKCTRICFFFFLLYIHLAHEVHTHTRALSVCFL